MDLTNIKYAGEAVFLLGAAYRLLRWALGAVEEGDAPPSAYADYGAPVPPIPLPTLSAQPDPPVIGTSSAVGSAVGPTATQVSAVSHVTNGSTPPRVSHLANTLTIPLPPSLLGTLGMLAMQQQNVDAPPHPGDPALFPQTMLDAMTPEQRAQVISTLVKQRSGGGTR